MKRSLALGVVAALASLPIVGPAQAGAATSQPAPGPQAAEARVTIAMRTTSGRFVSFKGGKLRIAARRKTTDFVVDKTTRCGDGVEFRCSDLKQKWYVGKPVRVAWHLDAKKRRRAISVGVPAR